MEVGNRPAIAQAAKPLRSAQPAFGQAIRQPKFSGNGDDHQRTGGQGFVNWVKRVANRILVGLHLREDRKMLENPEAFLTAEQNQIIQDFEKVEKDLQRVMAEREVEVNQLADLKKLELAEKNEALAAAKAMQDLGEAHAEFAAQKELAEREAREWQEAKAKRAEQEDLVADLNLEAEQAKMTLAEFKDKVEEIHAALAKSKRVSRQNAVLQRVEAAKRTVEKYTGERLSYSDEVTNLMREIEVENERVKLSISDGKNREERLAELRAKQRVEAQKTSAALDELLAEVNGENA